MPKSRGNAKKQANAKKATDKRTDKGSTDKKAKNATPSNSDTTKASEPIDKKLIPAADTIAPPESIDKKSTQVSEMTNSPELIGSTDTISPPETIGKRSIHSGDIASPPESVKTARSSDDAENPDTISSSPPPPSINTSGYESASNISLSPSHDRLHYLENKWTLWYYAPEKGKDWKDCQHKVYSFETVEHFWCMYDHMSSTGSIASGTDLALFKKDWRPFWEDPINRNGGRWIINVRAGRNSTRIDERNNERNKTDDVFLEILLFLIGEDFAYSDDVCGTVMSHRTHGDKVAIWTSNKIEENVKTIGRLAKERIKLQPPPSMSFESHAQTMHNAEAYGKTSSRHLFSV